MNDFRIHRDPESIAGLKLVWDKLLGETRNASFTQSWNWFHMAARLWENDYHPVVIEAHFSGNTLGLLPLLSDRRQNRWISPQSLLGFGQAAPVGQSTTATWMTAARLLRDSLDKSITWELGPFPHGTGSSARVTTVFNQLTLSTLSDSHFELPFAELARDSSVSSEANPFMPSRPGWKALFGHTQGSFDQEYAEDLKSSFLSRISHQDLPLGCFGKSRYLTSLDFEFLMDAFFDRGCIHLLIDEGFGGCVILGNRDESYLLPFGFRSLPEADRLIAMQDALGIMQQSGFQRTTLVGPDPILSKPFLLRQKLYAYRFVARKTAQTTLRHLWNRLTTAS